jgi:hypothetical protein
MGAEVEVVGLQDPIGSENERSVGSGAVDGVVLDSRFLDGSGQNDPDRASLAVAVDRVADDRVARAEERERVGVGGAVDPVDRDPGAAPAATMLNVVADDGGELVSADVDRGATECCAVELELVVGDQAMSSAASINSICGVRKRRVAAEDRGVATE